VRRIEIHGDTVRVEDALEATNDLAAHAFLEGEAGA